MAPFLLLLFLLSEAASQSDPTVVRVLPGDHAILSCWVDDSSIRAVKWRRPDLKPDNVFLYTDGHLKTDDQHPSFKDRVELVDRDLKDRDASLILKNVNINDTGTYECRVITGDTTLIKTFRTVHLQVSGSEDGNSSPVGLYLGLAAGVLVLVAAAVVGVLIYTKQRHKDKRSDMIVVTVHPGDDVILPCPTADSSIKAVQWSRPDLKPDIIILYSDAHLKSTYQHTSFKDRVDLVERDLKDKDVSLILKNVSRHDAGTYECRVRAAGSEDDSASFTSEPIRTIRLQVTEPADLIEVTVDPGYDVILPCPTADSSIKAVQWSRPDLEPDIIILYSDGHLKSTYQHTSFKDRVDLVERDLKDGDMSLILKNVSSIDAGTYECRVRAAGSEGDSACFTSEPIRIIRLHVTEPAGPPRKETPLL